jgi:hypothetical protein
LVIWSFTVLPSNCIRTDSIYPWCCAPTTRLEAYEVRDGVSKLGKEERSEMLAQLVDEKDAKVIRLACTPRAALLKTGQTYMKKKAKK